MNTPLVLVHCTSTTRSGWRFSSSSMFWQSTRCTDTPWLRVMKPMILSPGTGMQHRANLTQMSPTPLTEIPNELVVFLVRSTCLSGNASCSTSSSTSSLPASRTRCEMTFCVEIWPSPIATNTASALARFNSSATPTNASGVSSVVIGRLRLRMARVSSSRPSSTASVRRSLLNH